ncbi:MAG: TolC family protein [Parachlamydiaceae bacterium]
MSYLTVIFPIILSCYFSLAYGQEKLTLHQALQSGFNHSFDLKKAVLDIDIAEVNAQQASLLPNPQFSINGETSNFVRDYQEYPSVSYGLAQLIETRQKRRARRDVAAAMQGFAQASYSQSKVEYGFSIKEAFIGAALAKRRVDLAFQNRAIQENLLSCLNEKPEAENVLKSSEIKQFSACHMSELACKRKTHAYEEKKLELAYLIGKHNTDFDLDDALIDRVEVPQFCFDEKENCFLKVKDWQVEVALQQAFLEETKKKPDLSVNAGLFHEDGSQPSGIFLGLSFELPIFSNHETAISKAYLEVEKQEVSRQEFLKRMGLAFTKKKLAIEHAYEELLCYRNKILSKTHESYSQILDYHQDGKVDVCEVYKARLACLEQEEKYLELIENYQLSLLEFQKLMGRLPEM